MTRSNGMWSPHATSLKTYLQRIGLRAVVAVALRWQRERLEAELNALARIAAEFKATVRLRGVGVRELRRLDDALLGGVRRKDDIAIGHYKTLELNY